MPTITAANHLENAAVPMFESEEEEKGSITVLNDEGELTDGTLNLLDRIADHGFVIGFSHLSPEEAIPLVEGLRTVALRNSLFITPTQIS